MTEIRIEIFYEEGPRIVNIIDCLVEQEIDVLNFNSDDYENLINNVDFRNSVNKSIISSDSWLFDYSLDLEYNQGSGRKLDLERMKEAVVYDNIMIRVTKVGSRDLSFLSGYINNDSDNADHYKEFDIHFNKAYSVEDNFSDWTANSALSLESVLNL